MRQFSSFHINDPDLFIRKLLSWGKDFRDIAILNSNGYRSLFPFPHACHSFDFIAAFDSMDNLRAEDGNWINSLEEFTSKRGDWLFGHLGYDLKNEIENLSSGHPDRIKFPPAGFFIPAYIFIIRNKKLETGWHPDCTSEEEVKKLIAEIESIPVNLNGVNAIGKIEEVIPRSAYLETVEKIKAHIQRGDIYEVNFCQEFFSEKVRIDPLATWLKLIEESPTPFSCYYRQNEKYLLCSSPERFLKKTGNRIISQPIKGTAGRGKTPEEDKKLLEILNNDPKERAENIMITDLVRNDLSRIAARASVNVEELCAIYPYPKVHQMQSSISAKLNHDTSFTDIIRATFPMGSMTGAPKIRAMEIIEQYEKSKRGLYSGAVGYITPEMDFDFNVVIRSIQYDRSASSLSFMAGSAITGPSIPENEYRECLLKAGAIKKVLSTLTPHSQSATLF